MQYFAELIKQQQIDFSPSLFSDEGENFSRTFRLLLKHHAQGLFWKLQEIEVYVFFKIS